MLISILESGWSKLLPYGDSVAIIKDADESVSAGGILIPGAHQEYKRRGWVLAVGGGCRTKNGGVVLPPYEPGDYLFADRNFVRPNEDEDEIFHDPTIMVIPVHTADDKPLAYIKRADCVGGYARYAFPKKYEEILKKYGFKPQL